MNMKRMRGRNHRPNSGGGGSGFRNQQNGIPLNRNHVFDSSGPEMRIRGTAQQLYEKYQQLARDAFSNGDRVTGEAYYQHAEHYFRIISAINQAQGQPNQGQPNQGGQQNGQPYQGNGQERGNYNHNGQDRGHYQNHGDYNRREPNFGDVSTEPQPETRPDTRPQDQRPQDQRSQDPRPQDQRYQEPRRFEPRQNDQRNNDQRNNDQRHNENRHNEPRNGEPRHNEYRTNKPEFQRQDRQDRYRPAPVTAAEPPAIDTRIDPRIDISSALEAELAATVAEPAQLDLAGFGEQPASQARTEPKVPEPRSIPIIPDAPPAAPEAAAPAAKTPRPRGRPRAVKPEPEKTDAAE